MTVSGAARQGGTEQMTTLCPLHTYMHTDCKIVFLLASPDLCSQLPQMLLGCASEQGKKKHEESR